MQNRGGAGGAFPVLSLGVSLLVLLPGVWDGSKQKGPRRWVPHCCRWIGLLRAPRRVYARLIPEPRLLSLKICLCHGDHSVI